MEQSLAQIRCEDTVHQCADWVKRGECRAKPSYMVCLLLLLLLLFCFSSRVHARHAGTATSKRLDCYCSWRKSHAETDVPNHRLAPLDIWESAASPVGHASAVRQVQCPSMILRWSACISVSSHCKAKLKRCLFWV